VVQVCVLLAFAMIVFMMGVTIGLQYFDTHTSVGASSLPPGLVAGALPAAAAGGPAARLAAGDAEDGAEDAAAASAGDLLGAPDASTSPPSGPETSALIVTQEHLMLEGALDALEVSVGAWIYVEGPTIGASVKTIVSNRNAGCNVDASHRGFTFHVNNWETSDRALVLEYRTASGCGRISSDPETVPVDTWVHVGFAFQGPKAAGGGQGKVMLFLNGKLLRTAPNARVEDDVQRDGAGRFTIGSTQDRQFWFKGRIGQVFVSRGVITPRQLAATYKLTDAAGMLELASAAKDRLLAGLVLGHAGAGAGDGDISAGLEGTKVGVYKTPSAGNFLADVTGAATPRGMALVAGGAKKAAAKPAAAAAAAAAAEEEEVPAEEVSAAAAAAAEEEEAAAAPPPPARKAAAAKRAAAAAAGGGANNRSPASIRREGVPGTPSGSGFDFTSGANQWVKQMIRLPLSAASGSVTDPASLAAGTFSDEVTQEQLEKSDAEGRVRAEAVKKAMQHVWRNYKDHAWGYDELKPRGGHGDQNWGGMGMSLVDSLDTLWVMGMKDEFNEAKEWVRTSLDFNKHGATSVFEVTIRELGGLLAAYDLSGDKIFLDKAKDLGDRLLPAFNTPTGIPRAQITLATGWTSNPGWTGGSAILSELGTLQVEFRYLSHATGQPHYGAKAEAVIEKLEGVRPSNGLYPIYISSDSGTPTTGAITFGALGDSFYEYLVKVWVQGGRKETMYRRMYDAAMDGMTSLLLKRTSPSRLAYVADWDGGGTVDKMDHLVCFVPGMLALGAFNSMGTDGEADAARDLTNAKALAYTCWQMYERQATGIAAEFSEFPGGGDLVASPRAPFYILRPEAAESLYILHQLTGNPVYREWGWKMFSAIERYCKTDYGYGAHPDVRDTGRIPDDRMER
jgi:mannosyl-oligosaccharide alpha-1,2-mannosidase